MLAPHGVQTPVASDTTPALPRALTIPDSALSMGLLNIGSRGSGKTTLMALLALQQLRKGKPQVIIDPLGTLTDALLFFLLRSLQRVPPEKHPKIWRKLRYIDVGSTDVVTPFPIYTRRNGESL
jgi:DNA helicase HerA-like ATPase